MPMKIVYRLEIFVDDTLKAPFSAKNYLVVGLFYNGVSLYVLSHFEDKVLSTVNFVSPEFT